MGEEGAGGGTAGFELEEWGFDFKISAVIEEAADFADYP